MEMPKEIRDQINALDQQQLRSFVNWTIGFIPESFEDSFVEWKEFYNL